MSSLALYDKVNGSSGQARLDALNALREHLLVETTPQIAYVEGLKQSSNDVRRVVLDVLSARTATNSYDRTILNLIIRILQDSDPKNASISAVRTASSAFKCISNILRQGWSIDLLTSIEVQDIVEVASKCLSFGLSRSSRLATDKRRDSSTSIAGPGSALAFERNGGLPYAGAALSLYSVQKRGSTASLASQYSAASGVSAHDTDSIAASDDDDKKGDDRHDKQEKLAEAQQSVRYRSMICISLLNERAGRLLLVHWRRLLVGSTGSLPCSSLMDIANVDNFLGNRISAIHTIQSIISNGGHSGFMVGAEERSRLKAFTSLSGTIATAIVEVRKRLVHLLLDKTCPSSLLEATIRCTRALVLSTTQVKFQNTHSQILRPIALRLCSHADAAIAVPAYSLLSALANEGKGEEVASEDGIFSILQDLQRPLEVRIGAWTALTASISNLIQPDGRVMPLLRDALQATSPSELRQAAASYTLAASTTSGPNIDIDIIQMLSRDPSPTIRAIAADCLAFINDMGETLSTLLGDCESIVRASAIRAVGVKLQRGAKMAYANEHISRSLKDQSLLVRMRASWALGNLCDHSTDYEFCLQQCHSVRQDDEKVSVNAIRGIGAVLSRCPTEDFKQLETLVKEALHWLISALSSITPKVRWNAAASFARAFDSETNSRYLLTLFDVTEPISIRLVEEKAFKVRLSLAQALSNLLKSSQMQSATIRRAIEEASVKIEEQMKEATFKEIQLHGLPLQQLLKRLLVALPE